MQKHRFTTKDIAYIGLSIALCTAAFYIKIPFGTGAMVHLGTAAMLIIAIVFGGVYAGLGAGLGAFIFDILGGFSPYAVWSLAIKLIAGFAAGSVASGIWPESSRDKSLGMNYARGAAACVTGALVNLAGYFFAWWQVIGSMESAIANIPSSLISSGIGTAVALIIAPALRQALVKAKLV